MIEDRYAGSECIREHPAYMSMMQLREQLLAALTLQPNQPNGPGRYMLTVEAEVKYGDTFSLNGRDWFGIDSITGTWRKA